MIRIVELSFIIVTSVLLAACPAGPQPGLPDLPDLMIASLTPSNVSPAVALDTDWPFSVVVTNQGRAAAGESTLRYQVTNAFSGQVLSIDVPIGTLDPGQSITVSPASLSTMQLSGLGLGPGTNTVTATVNAGGISEADTANNTYGLSATLPVLYPRIIVDTYEPNEETALSSFASGEDSLFLFELTPGGDLVELASDLNLTDAPTYVPGNPDSGAGYHFAYIDYQGGLAPGTYYVKIASNYPGRPLMTGAYAIRMLNTPDLQQPRASTWHYAAYSDDSSCETDDGGPPAVLPLAIQIGQSLNRSLSASTEIDWVGLTLP